MPNPLATRTSKAALATAAALLGAGALSMTAAALTGQPETPKADAVRISEETDDDALELETADADDDAKDDAVESADAKAEHDNFGAIVSADAQDGGVDGQEISEMARARAEARQAANEHGKAGEEHGKAGEDHGPADAADTATDDDDADDEATGSQGAANANEHAEDRAGGKD